MSEGIEQGEGEGLWVTTEPVDGGGYITVVSVDADWSVRLNRDEALAYAATTVESAQRAEYDAAVIKQLHRGLKIDMQLVGAVLTKDIRPDRRPLSDAAPGLRFEPGVNADLKPFITIVLNGKPHAQMDCADLRNHAMHVLETPIAADLDAGYRQALVGLIGLDPAGAAAVVGDLGNFR